MKILSVSDFVTAVSSYLEQGLGSVAVQGEVVDYRISHDKFVWFELKDAKSRVKCFAMKWEMNQILEDGMEIVAVGIPKLFQKSGGFHIRVQSVELKGEGALRRAFELTKKRLEEEGLFDPKYKQSLPRFPERIGLVTSREAAAYGDVLRILENRWRGLDIFLASIKVQGAGAERQIVRALEFFNTAHPVDVLLLTRGGGSLEDLQAFNSEKVARSVFSSKIPIVVAIGHERDECLAEYAADVRASTPSNAAEVMVPDRRDIEYQLGHYEQLLARSVDDELSKAVRSVDLFVDILDSIMEGAFVRYREIEQRLRHTLALFDHRRARHFERYSFLRKELLKGCGSWLTNSQKKVKNMSILFRSLDPKATLKRGYSITFLNDKVLSSVSQVKKGDKLKTRLNDGEIYSEATSN